MFAFHWTKKNRLSAVVDALIGHKKAPQDFSDRAYWFGLSA
ncbi:hypothetical protein [Diaphorobacter sp. HDW4B]|nr:hypothetical protein [Diaphorobacter sp. HDW4B]